MNLLLCSKIDKKESKEKLEQRKKAKIDATDRDRMCENQGLFSDDTMHFVKLRSIARITNCQKIQSMTHLNKLRPSVWRAQTLARCERKKGGSVRDMEEHHITIIFTYFYNHTQEIPDVYDSKVQCCFACLA